MLLWGGRDGLASSVFNPFKLIPENPSGTQVIGGDTQWIHNKQMSLKDLKEDKREGEGIKVRWDITSVKNCYVYTLLESNTKVAFPCQITRWHSRFSWNSLCSLFFFLSLSIITFFSVYCGLVLNPNTPQLSQIAQILEVFRNKVGKKDLTQVLQKLKVRCLFVEKN